MHFDLDGFFNIEFTSLLVMSQTTKEEMIEFIKSLTDRRIDQGYNVSFLCKRNNYSEIKRLY